MHPQALLAFASAIGAVALASAITGREPDRRANRLMSALLLCAGLWSLLELLWQAAPDAELAATYMRWGSLCGTPIGALLLHLLVTSAPGFERYRPLLLPAYAVAAVVAALSVSTDLVVAGAQRTAWGFSALPGSALPGVYGLLASAPLAAGLGWVSRGPRSPRGLLSPVVLAGGACFAIASATEVLLPVQGFAAPHLGNDAVVTWGAAAWWSIYRFREPLLTPRRFAREILETLPHGVALLRRDGRIRSTNQRLAQLAERDPEQLLGVRVEDLLTDPAREPAGADGRRECELSSASGRRIPVSVSHAPLEDEDGNTVGHVLAVHDLREVTELRSRLVASGRLVAVGQLAAGIAHEINNPIAYVRSNLRLLEEHWQKLAGALGHGPRGPLLREALEEGPARLCDAGEGVDRVAQIVRDVGGFSRGGAVAEEPASLDELLTTAVRVAKPQLGQLRIERSGGLAAPVPCVPQELIQVFLNLLLNAARACGPSGRIRLATWLEGDSAVVEVADDGPGIAPELRARIFEPFFTTRPVGEGTGLGLSISKQIAASHGGRIEVASEPGRGSSFRVRLPARGAPKAASGERA
jgi:PAS domain S-box-containing protein